MIGPPLSFALALNYGFTVMFLIAAATFAVCVLLVGFMLPSVPRAVDDEGLRKALPRRLRPPVPGEIATCAGYSSPQC